MKSFTLIEVIIAVFILTVGIVGVLAAFPLATKIQKSAQMTATAIRLGQAKIEELFSKSYQEISATTTSESLPSPFSAYQRETRVDYYDPVNSTATDTDSGIKKVEVIVSWKSPLGFSKKSINLISFITKR